MIIDKLRHQNYFQKGSKIARNTPAAVERGRVSQPVAPIVDKRRPHQSQMIPTRDKITYTQPLVTPLLPRRNFSQAHSLDRQLYISERPLSVSFTNFTLTNIFVKIMYAFCSFTAKLSDKPTMTNCPFKNMITNCSFLNTIRDVCKWKLKKHKDVKFTNKSICSSCQSLSRLFTLKLTY